MSDIYLQITETPTVVTLSAPVISGALSSTVTVANTVTVALDSNSLSALENVTVTVGAAVSISNFPASQAVTFSAVTISNFPATQPVSIASVTIGNTVTIAGTVTANPTGTQTIAGTVTANVGDSLFFNYSRGVSDDGGSRPNLGIQIGYTDNADDEFRVVSDTAPLPISGTVTVGNSVTIGSLPAISGTVTANLSTAVSPSIGSTYGDGDRYPVGTTIIPVGGWTAEIDGAHWQALKLTDSGELATIASLQPSVHRIGVVTIGAGTVTIGAGTAQIGSVTASISGTVPISISSVTVGNSVTIASLPAISGTVTANTFALQGTAVTTSDFTSTTASTLLAGFNATREVLTIFNEGAGNLHICAGATCTTIAYQVRLSAGDYYEVPNHQTTVTHSAVFATAGTARVTQVS